MSVSMVMRQSSRLVSIAATFPIWLTMPLNMVVLSGAEEAHLVFSEHERFFESKVDALRIDSFEHRKSLRAQCVRSREQG